MLRICTCHLILEFGRKKIISIFLYVSLYSLVFFACVYHNIFLRIRDANALLNHWQTKDANNQFEFNKKWKSWLSWDDDNQFGPNNRSLESRKRDISSAWGSVAKNWKSHLFQFNLFFIEFVAAGWIWNNDQKRFAFKLQNWTQLTTCKIPTTLNCSIYEDCPPAWWYRSQFSQIASFIRFCTKRLAKALKRKGCFALVHCRFRAPP